MGLQMMKDNCVFSVLVAPLRASQPDRADVIGIGASLATGG